MKRSPALISLSRDHHGALSLANRIARAEGDAALAGLTATVAEKFRCEIEPHFRREEEGLLVRLAEAGEQDLVSRTLSDHRQLREFACRIAAGDTEALKPFGCALRDHVRFEERELFARAETLAG